MCRIACSTWHASVAAELMISTPATPGRASNRSTVRTAPSASRNVIRNLLARSASGCAGGREATPWLLIVARKSAGSAPAPIRGSSITIARASESDAPEGGFVARIVHPEPIGVRALQRGQTTGEQLHRYDCQQSGNCFGNLG